VLLSGLPLYKGKVPKADGDQPPSLASGCKCCHNRLSSGGLNAMVTLWGCLAIGYAGDVLSLSKEAGLKLALPFRGTYSVLGISAFYPA
jgi:hypothetical protein